MRNLIRVQGNDKHPLASVYIKPKPGSWWRRKADTHLAYVGSANTLQCGYIECKTGSQNNVDSELVKLYPILEGGYTLYLFEASIQALRTRFKPNFNDALWPDYIHDVFRRKRSISVWIVTEHMFTKQGVKCCAKAIRLCYDKYGNFCGDKNGARKMYIL